MDIKIIEMYFIDFRINSKIDLEKERKRKKKKAFFAYEYFKVDRS